MIERQIHDGVIAYLRKEGLSYIHHRMDKKSGIASGFPDFCIIHCGRACLIEIKTESGKLSEIQKKVIEDLLKNGTPTIVARSVEQAVAAIQAWLGIEWASGPRPAPTEAKPGDTSKLYICDWQGQPWVAQKAETGPDVLLHRAEPIDLQTLTRL